MLGPEISNSRLRDVIDFEVDYTIKGYEKQIQEKDDEIVEINKELVDKDKELVDKNKELVDKDEEIVEKDNEITLLKAKLEENGI